MLKISCGEKVTEDEYKALLNTERRLLEKIVKEMRMKNKFAPEAKLREMAFHIVLSRSVERLDTYE